MSEPFTDREQRAWGLIGEAFESVMTLDERGRLEANVSEIAQATHVLQSAVIQHMNHRHWPDQFSDWWESAYTPLPPPAGPSWRARRYGHHRARGHLLRAYIFANREGRQNVRILLRIKLKRG